MSSLASERMLIYAALSESKDNIFPSLASSVRSEDFIEEAHQSIWRKRISSEECGLAHDLMSLVTSMQRSRCHFGGVEYLTSIVRDDLHANISSVALQAAAARVHELAGLRAITKTMKEAIQMAETGLLGRDGVVNMVGDAVDVIRNERNAHNSSATHIREFVGLALEQIESRASGVIPDNLTTTGFPEQDQILSGGFADGDLIILAARPSMGKTAISLAFAEAAAKDRAVFYASTEQSGLALTYRSLASASRINSTKLREADLQDDDYARLAEGAQKVGELDIFIDETSSLTLPELCNKVRTFATDVRQRTGKKILVFVDYLQRLQAHRNADRAVVLGEITTGLKNLAKEIGCPVVLLAQLNRKVEDRTSKRPMMSDLAESGKIEQDADVIIFLYRDEYYNPATTKEPGITEVITGKNRDGKVGMVKLAFQVDQLRYSSMAFGGSTDF